MILSKIIFYLLQDGQVAGVLGECSVDKGKDCPRVTPSKSL